MGLGCGWIVVRVEGRIGIIFPTRTHMNLAIDEPFV